MTRARIVPIPSALVLWLVLLSPAHADDPALLSFGVGYFDQTVINPGIGYLNVSDRDNHQEAADFRLEYRFGTSLLPLIEPWATIKPWAGLEVTSDGAVYGVSGLLVDVPLGSFVLTPSAGIGLYESGAGKDLGSVIEFRAQLELGYQFENQSRLSLSYSHISNANISETNPGSNIIGLYLHLPTNSIFGH